MSRDKNPTLKITLPNGMSLIKFGSSEEEYEQMHKGINNIMKHISNADKIGANFINEIENKHDKYT